MTAAAHGSERRTAEQRATARRLGVDRYGRPTARTLGVAPRQLRELYPDLSSTELISLSARLRRDELRRRRLLEPSSLAAAAPAAAIREATPRDRQAVKAPLAPTPQGLTA